MGDAAQALTHKLVNAGSLAFTTSWFIVGNGITARISSSGQEVLLK